MTEKDIIAQSGDYWVLRTKYGYVVYRDGATVATADSTYPYTEDGKSIATARMRYLANRAEHFQTR